MTVTILEEVQNLCYNCDVTICFWTNKKKILLKLKISQVKVVTNSVFFFRKIIYFQILIGWVIFLLEIWAAVISSSISHWKFPKKWMQFVITDVIIIIFPDMLITFKSNLINRLNQLSICLQNSFVFDKWRSYLD